MVVMVPQTILKLSLTTLAIGARQLVVHDALEMTWWFAASYLSSLTPITMVISSLVAGAVMMTFFTGPRRCCFASSPLVNLPVASMTTCAPTDAQSSLEGSFSAKTRMFLPSTLIESAVAEILLGRLPRMESYFSRCASVFGLVRSLTATKSKLSSVRAVRRILRPMRPKPLIPTLIAISPHQETELNTMNWNYNRTTRNTLLGETKNRSTRGRGRQRTQVTIQQRSLCFANARDATHIAPN